MNRVLSSQKLFILCLHKIFKKMKRDVVVGNTGTAHQIMKRQTTSKETASGLTDKQ